jgi:hypothetical protein
VPIFQPRPKRRQVTTNVTGRPSSSAFGTVVTAGGTAHTLGSSFTDLITPAHDVYELYIFISDTFTSNTQTDALVNLYIGSAGNEVLFIEGLLAGWCANLNGGTLNSKRYRFPVFVPAGTRISAKSQSIVASKNVDVAIYAAGGKPSGWVGTGVETLGLNTASSQGTSVTPGTTSEGSFTSIGTSGKHYGYVFPMVQGTLADTGVSNNVIALDIGSGGTVFPDLEDLFHHMTGSTESGGNLTEGAFCDIPSGTALQLRAQISGSTAEAVDCAIYGVF